MKKLPSAIRKSIINLLVLGGGLFLLSFLLVGCDPSKRLTALAEKYPYLLKDTVIQIKDTVIVNGKTILDSVFVLSPGDTVFFDNEEARGYFTKTDTLYKLKIKTKADTIYREHTRVIQQYAPKIVKKPFPWWIIPISLFGIGVLVFVIKLRK